VLLFVLWGPLTELAKLLIPLSIFSHFNLIPAPSLIPDPWEVFSNAFGSATRDLSFTIHFLFQLPYRLIDLATPHDAEDMWITVTISVLVLPGPFAGAFVSTVRILFSAFFVACFVLRRLVLRPLAKLGFIWLTSGKPIFATMFGAIAAVIVFGQKLFEALS
jgi:hypothetical protein